MQPRLFRPPGQPMIPPNLMQFNQAQQFMKRQPYPPQMQSTQKYYNTKPKRNNSRKKDPDSNNSNKTPAEAPKPLNVCKKDYNGNLPPYLLAKIQIITDNDKKEQIKDGKKVKPNRTKFNIGVINGLLFGALPTQNQAQYNAKVKLLHGTRKGKDIIEVHRTDNGAFLGTIVCLCLC